MNRIPSYRGTYIKISQKAVELLFRVARKFEIRSCLEKAACLRLLVERLKKLAPHQDKELVTITHGASSNHDSFLNELVSNLIGLG